MLNFSQYHYTNIFSFINSGCGAKGSQKSELITTNGGKKKEVSDLDVRGKPQRIRIEYKSIPVPLINNLFNIDISITEN